MDHKLLGEQLVELGMVTSPRVEHALLWQRDDGGRLGSVLLKLGYVEEAGLLELLSDRLGAEPVILKDLWVDPAAIELLAGPIARQTNAIPIGIEEKGTLLVAMSDPDNLFAIEDLEAATGLNIVARLASDPAIAEGLDRFYPVEEH